MPPGVRGKKEEPSISSEVAGSPPIAIDQSREDRIDLEVIADCNGPDERAMGWYYYLEEQVRFPFAARCTVRRATSPLRPDDRVHITGLAPADECEHAIFVTISWERDSLAVPLSRLEPEEVDEGTAHAVGDWLYWTGRGYKF